VKLVWSQMRHFSAQIADFRIEPRLVLQALLLCQGWLQWERRTDLFWPLTVHKPSDGVALRDKRDNKALCHRCPSTLMIQDYWRGFLAEPFS
jgi:hypothetical protein